MSLKASFWGCTGSIPAPLNTNQLDEKLTEVLWQARDMNFGNRQAVRDFVAQLPFPLRGTYKGNTSCIQIHNSQDLVILCDAGSGLRAFSDALPDNCPANTYHLFLTHLHWDHIQGFPFFKPAYQPGNKIIIHSLHDAAEDALRNLLKSPYFPIDFDSLPADIDFDIGNEGRCFQLGNLAVKTLKQDHPDHSWAFRFEEVGESVVVSTDSQHPHQAADESNYPFLEFFNEADILIFDAQYALLRSNEENRKWGHSDVLTAVELAHRAKIKNLIITHHEPSNNDTMIHALLDSAEKHRTKLNAKSTDKCHYPKEILLAYDGLTVQT